MKKTVFSILALPVLVLVLSVAFVACSGGSPTGSSSKAVIRDAGGDVVLGGELRLQGQPGAVVGGTDPVTGDVFITEPLAPGFYAVDVFLNDGFVAAAVIEVEDDGSIEVDDGDEDSSVDDSVSLDDSEDSMSLEDSEDSEDEDSLSLEDSSEE